MPKAALIGTIAFWIAPNGDVHTIPSNHISYIIDNADLFDADMNYMRQCYESYDEHWRSEGQAREKIIRAQVVKGWIRVRRYRERYSINVGCLDPATKGRLAKFAHTILYESFDNRYESDKTMPLHITVLSRCATEDSDEADFVEIQKYAQLYARSASLQGEQ